MSKYRIIKCTRKNGDSYYEVQKQYSVLFFKIWYTRSSLNDWEFCPEDTKKFFNIEAAKTCIASDKEYDKSEIKSREIIKDS